MTHLSPFADDTAVLELGGLSVENGRDRIALHGAVEISRDQAGLGQAKALLALLTDVVRVLSDDPALPRAAPPAKAAAGRTVPNPFG